MRAFLLSLLFVLPLTSFAAKAGTYEVKIDGMTCEPCAQSVTKALQKIPNLEKDAVTVVLKENKATVRTANVSKETSEQIKQAITKAGYTVTSIVEK